MCTDAYREALTRDLQRRANPGPRDLERRGAAAAGIAAENTPAMAPAKDATVVNDDAIDQH
jgi:hypothetical protein